MCTHGSVDAFVNRRWRQRCSPLEILDRRGIRDGDHQASVFAGFEKYTKVSKKSKEMPASAQLSVSIPRESEVGVETIWLDGGGGLASPQRRAEPLDTEGQHPHNKTDWGKTTHASSCENGQCNFIMMD